jgi:hypothetical protein
MSQTSGDQLMAVSKIRTFKAAAIAWLLASGAPALAQECTSDDPCSVSLIKGKLSEGSAEIELSLKSGEALIVDVIEAGGGGGFDPMLNVVDAGGETIASDDDGGFGLGARVLLIPEDRSRTVVTLQISPSGGGGEGENSAFDVLVRPAGFTPTPVRRIDADATQSSFRGELRGIDPQKFRFTSERGREWQFDAAGGEGTEVDPVLRITQLGSPESQLAYDDDGGEGYAASLSFVTPSDGEYIVEVGQSLSNDGPYQLTVVRGDIIPIPVIEPRELGLAGATGTFVRTFDVDDEAVAEFFFSEEVAARLMAENRDWRRLEINLRRIELGDADPMLELGVKTGFGFATIMSDDDGGEGLNSRLVVSASDMISGEGLGNLLLRAKNLNSEPDEFVLTLNFIE